MEGLTQMKRLVLYANRLTDVAPLADMRRMRYLDLTQNQIVDIGPLDGLTKLEILQLNQNKITNVKALAGMRDLRVLSLQHNQITDLKPLVQLTKLKELHLNNNQITDLRPLAGMKELRTLHLGGNQITDLTPLMGLNALRELSIIGSTNLRFPDVAKLQKALPRTVIQHNATQTEIQFINKTTGSIVVRWVDFGGALQTYQGNLLPGKGYSQHTYIGHQWVLYDKAGKELGRTFATGKITAWEIYTTGIKTAPARNLPIMKREE